jgi:TMEM175 potassium channel family protein
MDESHEEAREAFQVERIAFFSDAVFAIAITLLVLEIKVPHVEPGAGEAGVLHALLQQVPKVTGFLVSFLVIGTFWMAHHRLFRWVGGYDRWFIWLNLFFLLGISFIPFPTAFFSEYLRYQTSLIFYAASLALTGVAQVGVVRYVRTHRELQVPGTPEGTLAQIQGRSWAVPTVCLLAIALSFLNVVAARLALLAIPLAVRIFEGALAKRNSKPHPRHR